MERERIRTLAVVGLGIAASREEFEEWLKDDDCLRLCHSKYCDNPMHVIKEPNRPNRNRGECSRYLKQLLAKNKNKNASSTAIKGLITRVRDSCPHGNCKKRCFPEGTILYPSEGDMYAIMVSSSASHAPLANRTLLRSVN